MQEKGRKNFRAPTSRRPPHKTPPKNKRMFLHVIADDVLAKKNKEKSHVRLRISKKCCTFAAELCIYVT